MEPSVIIQKERESLIKKVDYAKASQQQREFVRNARLAEGPEDNAVISVSRKVGFL
jgi:hypothetical protein